MADEIALGRPLWQVVFDPLPEGRVAAFPALGLTVGMGGPADGAPTFVIFTTLRLGQTDAIGVPLPRGAALGLALALLKACALDSTHDALAAMLALREEKPALGREPT